MIIATDLDRTLLPNGLQEYDNSMDMFSKIVKDFKLIYVTGRNMHLFYEAVKKFNTPLPDFIITQVGIGIFYKQDYEFKEDEEWIKIVEDSVKDCRWDVDRFKDVLKSVKELRIQEEESQNRFKLSYYIDDPVDVENIVKEVTGKIKDICKKAAIVYSLDESHNIGLLDIIPKTATKVDALEYLRKKLNEKKDNVVYCGDSGNDILALTFGYKAIIVRNAIKEVKDAVKEMCIQKGIADRLYIAEGYKKLNGYYVSGIIEGLIKFGIIKEEVIGNG